MTPMHVAALLVVPTAAFAALNHRLLRLPTSIALVFSIVVQGLTVGPLIRRAVR